MQNLHNDGPNLLDLPMFNASLSHVLIETTRIHQFYIYLEGRLQLEHQLRYALISSKHASAFWSTTQSWHRYNMEILTPLRLLMKVVSHVHTYHDLADPSYQHMTRQGKSCFVMNKSYASDPAQDDTSEHRLIVVCDGIKILISEDLMIRCEWWSLITFVFACLYGDAIETGYPSRMERTIQMIQASIDRQRFELKFLHCCANQKLDCNLLSVNDNAVPAIPKSKSLKDKSRASTSNWKAQSCSAASIICDLLWPHRTTRNFKNWRQFYACSTAQSESKGCTSTVSHLELELRIGRCLLSIFIQLTDPAELSDVSHDMSLSY